MRAAAILGLGCSLKNLKPFQDDNSVDWRIGMPSADDEVDIILLFGGDGTIHRHLSPLAKLGVPVLVVPAGSGNDFARALGLRRVGDSVAAWQKFRGSGSNVRTIDLGIITPLESTDRAPALHQADHLPAFGTQTYFCCVAGVGLDCEVARRANQLPRWLRGHGGYLVSLPPALFRFAPVSMKILSSPQGTDTHISAPTGTHWITASDQPTVLVAFANTPVYGGGMKIAPRARMDDGQLDVCFVTKINKAKLFSLFPTVYFGRHLHFREVEYFQAPRFRVETESPLHVYADGEYVCGTPVEVGLLTKALTVVTP